MNRHSSSNILFSTVYNSAFCRVFSGISSSAKVFGFTSGVRFSTSPAVGRVIRSIEHRSRFDILDNDVRKPIYMSECKGTPRRPYPENLIDGVRTTPTFNPYVKLTKAKRYVLDNWPSRNWDQFDPRRVYVRGSRRRYDIPKDILPYKDELGEWHPPKLSGRYRADVERQYRLNGLPWVWDKAFYTGSMHFHDEPPLGPKIWYKQEIKRERINEAMKKMDDTLMKHKKEVRAGKSLNWLEKTVKALAKPAKVSVGSFIRRVIKPKL